MKIRIGNNILKYDIENEPNIPVTLEFTPVEMRFIQAKIAGIGYDYTTNFNFSFIPPNLDNNNTDADISLFIEGSGNLDYGIEDNTGDYFFNQ